MPHKIVTKTCGDCGKTWESAFTGRMPSKCEICWNRSHRERNRKSSNYWSTKYRLRIKYGMTIEQFEEMLRAQNNRCKIGGEEFGEGCPPVVDHNHTTGMVRGLLCKNCNTGIGMLKESPDRLFAAFNYLEDDKLGIKR